MKMSIVIDGLTLKDSPNIVEIGRIKFFFSTPRKLNKFVTELEYETAHFNERLNRLYKKVYDIQLDDLALIRFYKYVERDDFYIEIDGIGIDCLNQIQIVSEVKVVERVS